MSGGSVFDFMMIWFEVKSYSISSGNAIAVSFVKMLP
jgi:hypothetical protein